MGKKLLAVLGMLSRVQNLPSKTVVFSPSKYNYLVIFNVKIVRIY